MSDNMNVSGSKHEARVNEPETITIAYEKDYVNFMRYIEYKKTRGEYPFRCHECNFETGLVTRMKWHRWNECKSKLCACIYCGKTFDNLEAKVEHLRTAHLKKTYTFLTSNDVIIIDDSSEDSEDRRLPQQTNGK